MTSIDPPSDPDERLGILIEKSVRGALSEDEQRELGEALASDPRLQQELDRSIDESANIRALVERAMNEFDEETARQAIQAEHAIAKRVRILMPLMATMMIGSFAWVSGGLAAFRSPFFLFVAGLMLATMLVTWSRLTRDGKRLLAAERIGDTEFRAEYSAHGTRVRGWIHAYQLGAVLNALLFAFLLVDSLQSGQRLAWHAGFLIGALANVYFAFNRRNLDRMRGFRLGVLDRKGRPIAKKGGIDDAA